MAEPVKPVIANGERFTNEQLLDAPGCIPLPALVLEMECGHKQILSRWKLSPEERAEVARTGDIYLLCYGGQPPVEIMGIAPSCAEDGRLTYHSGPDALELMAQKEVPHGSPR